MGSWIIHQTDRGAEDEGSVLLVTNGYYWLLTVTNGYSGLLGARPGSFKNGRTGGTSGGIFWKSSFDLRRGSQRTGPLNTIRIFRSQGLRRPTPRVGTAQSDLCCL